MCWRPLPRCWFVTLLLLPVLGLPACGKTGEDYARQVVRGLDQGKIVGTRGTMEAFGRALQAARVDRGDYPRGQTIDDAVSILSPAFIRSPVVVVAWGNHLEYRSDGQSYTLRSPGADANVGTPDDIVMTDGEFTQLPAPAAP